jgi:hypothetical protein
VSGLICLRAVVVVVLLMSCSFTLLLWGAMAPIVMCCAHAGLKCTTLSSKMAAKVDTLLNKADEKLDNLAKKLS